MDRAACTQATPDKREDGKDPFFPERGEARLVEEARILCVNCPVFRQCADYQGAQKNKYGVWAGQRYSPG